MQPLQAEGNPVSLVAPRYCLPEAEFFDLIRPVEGADMSILETKVVDVVSVAEWEPESVILVISDHLKWGDKVQQGEHLLLMQEKINTYITYIESGEMLESYPPSKGKLPIIRISGLYELPEQAEFFVHRAAQTLKEVGIGFEFVLDAYEDTRSI